MTLQQLRYFLATCKHGSFVAAADSLYLAQPSLADQIRRLEGELNVGLFVRSGRKLALTEAGITLRPHAEAILAAVEAAEASVSEVRELKGGIASLGAFGVGFHFFVREVISEFAAKHPDVTVRVVGQNTVEVCEKVRAGELEAGLAVLPFDESGLEVRPVMTDENLYCTTDEEVASKPVTIEQLADRRLIVYDAHFGWHDPTRRQLTQRARAANVNLVPAIEVESLQSALDLSAQGLGDTYTLRSVCEEAGFPQRLRTTTFDPPLYDTFAVVWRKGAKLSPATQELVRLAERQLLQFGRPVLPPSDD
jgi:DNA-binding transcriptional LysR family regulator